MRVVLGSNQLTSINGAETYLVTVAEQLQGLGHEVTLFGLELGEMAAFARGRGLSVAASEDHLPATCDALMANDAVTAFTLADRYPGAPQVFVAHSEDLAFCTPPQLRAVTSAVAVLNDRVARRLETIPLDSEVVRLSQPIDRVRFWNRGSIRPRPRRVLMLGNYLYGEQRETLMRAWGDGDLEWMQVGRHGTATPEPEVAIGDADIVVGHGRAVLEAMSSARAVYVFDHSGADGWVTPERYSALEADGFAGHAFGEVIDGARLRRDLGLYRPEMGPDNMALTELNHRADHHAQELVRLFSRLAPRPAVDDAPLREMARLASLEWGAVGRAADLELENRALRARVHAAEPVADQLTALVGTRRYRLLQRLLRPLDDARRSWRERSGRASAPAADDTRG